MSDQKKRVYKLDINAADHAAATSVQLADQLLHDTVKLADTARRISNEGKAMLALLNAARQTAIHEGYPVEPMTDDIVSPTNPGMIGRVQAVRAAHALATIFRSFYPTQEGLLEWEKEVRKRRVDTPFSISGYSLSPMKNTGTDRLMVRFIRGDAAGVSHYMAMSDLLTLAIYGAKVLEKTGHLILDAERDEDDEDEDDD